MEAPSSNGIKAQATYQSKILTEFWEDIALLKYYKQQMKTKNGRAAIDKLTYATIVLHHKNQGYGSQLH